MSAESLVVDVGAVSAYPAAPQFLVAFTPNYLLCRVETGSPGVLLSFDGVNDHVHVKAADPNLYLPSHVQKVWLKEDGVGACTVRIGAYTNA